MVFSWNRCEACIHNDICNRKSQFETLTQKIKNVDKNKPYEGSRVMIECSYYRNNGEPDQFQFAVGHREEDIKDMFGVVLGSIIGLILLMFVIVLAFMVVAEYMDGSWRWGVRDEKREEK